MQENHPFDNYFGVYPGVASGYGLNLNTQNCVVLNPPSQCYKPFDADGTQVNLVDLAHQTVEAAQSYDNGKMDGFVYAAAQNGSSNPNYAMAYYTSKTIPNYWDYAGYYSLDANFFQSAMDYSYPNHLYAVSAQGGGIDGVRFNITLSNIATELNASGISWKYYMGNWNDSLDCQPLSRAVTGTEAPKWPFIWGVLVDYPAIEMNPTTCQNLQSTKDLTNDINSGYLPQVSWIVPNSTEAEHPGSTPKFGTIAGGQLFTASVINAISSNPSLWSSTAVFVTWDEWGGYYDGVVPTQVDPYGFGFRVPLLVISPYAVPGIYYGVNGAQEDFSSFLSTIENNWGLSPLSQRDASELPLWYMFNFNQSPLPALVLPSTTLAAYPYTNCVNTGACKLLYTTSTTVAASSTSITIGVPTTLTLTTTVADTTTAITSPPTGRVTWSDGGKGGTFSSSSCSLSSISSSSGSCFVTYTPSLTVTSKITITGTYSGDVTHTTSSGSSSITVNKRSASTTVLASPTSVGSAGMTTLSVTVADASAGSPSFPSGTVTWSASVSGGSFSSTTCTLVAISSTQSQCTVTYTAPTTAGTVIITAKYNGDSTHKTSSGTSQLTVT